MSTLEDKILGEKIHNYCSSGEDSDTYDSDSEKADNKRTGATKEEAALPEVDKWEGTSSNTGPKGVIKDWQRYKQLETEKRIGDDKEKIELMKKLTMSVQTALDQEREKAAADDDPELAELLDDEFLVNYQKQRMKEMIERTNHNIRFGNLIMLNDSNEFLDAIDKENKFVKVIVHIYEERNEACRTMNHSLKALSKIYDNVKFCSIVGSRAGLSKSFNAHGVPAFLIYKGGQLLGTYLRLTDDLGQEFDAQDVQNFLVEHGMLEDKSCVPILIRSKNDDEEDSE